jgi:putative ribosome biogenesis GTPase RsgA
MSEKRGKEFEITDSEPLAKKQALIKFIQLPENDILPFQQVKDICRDFNVDNFKSDILVTGKMKEIYGEIQSDALPAIFVLRGASGVGKTTILLFVGHMARKSGCLVFPI